MIKINEILQIYHQSLGDEYDSYLNHCLRVKEFCKLLDSKLYNTYQREIDYALAYHDLGIWTHSFDYLGPSINLALQDVNQKNLNPVLISLIIEFHHKLSRYTGEYENVVNLIRKADLIDLSMNLFSFKVDKKSIKEINHTYSYRGFHRSLLLKTISWILFHPLNPFPMFKI